MEDININLRLLLKNGKDRLYNFYNERINFYKKFLDIEILNDKLLNNVVYNIINVVSENFKFDFKEK